MGPQRKWPLTVTECLLCARHLVGASQAPSQASFMALEPYKVGATAAPAVETGAVEVLLRSLKTLWFGLCTWLPAEPLAHQPQAPL